METKDIIIHIICFVGSLLGTYLVIPKIIGIARFKKLSDSPNWRSSHTSRIPRLGGVAFFMTFVIGLYILRGYDEGDVSISMIAGMTVLFITGLKDDLTVVAPSTKLIAQIIACTLILFNPEFHIRGLTDAHGIGDVDAYLAGPLGAVFMLYLINAFNLIDGIDGLAAFIGIIVFTVFGAIFFYLNKSFYVGISLLGLGTLIGFLRFNLSRTKKIFMGDTGSMILGFVIAILAMRIPSFNVAHFEKFPIPVQILPIFILVVLFVPLFDTGRVFLVRVLKGKSPFSADRNHIHHRIMDTFGLSHRRTSFYIAVGNVILIILFFVAGMYLSFFQMIGLLLFFIGFFLLSFSRYGITRRGTQVSTKE